MCCRFKRALHAIGLDKRTGDKADLDEFTFKQMDKNGDGKLTIEEFDAYLPLALRAKLEAKLDAGWKFDEEKWKASQERHAKWNMQKVFKMFGAPRRAETGREPRACTAQEERVPRAVPPRMRPTH